MSFTINRELLPVKMSYFTLSSAIGILFPFLTVYMQQKGLSPSECAIVVSVSLVATTPVRAVIGMIADKLQRHIQILSICCIFTAFFHLALLFVPSQHTGGNTPSTSLNFHCVDSASIELLFSSTCRPNESRVPRTLIDFEASPSGLLERPADAAFTVSPTLRCEVFCCSATLVLPRSDRASQTTLDTNQATDGGKRNDATCYVSFSANHVEQMCTVRINSRSDRTSTNEVENSYTDELLNVCNDRFTVEQSCTEACSEMNDTTLDIRHVHHQPASSSLFGKTFWIFFALCFAGSCFFSPLFSIIDGLAYGCLGDNSSKFGQQRLWGSVGFGLFAVFSGVLMDSLQMDDANKNYTASFVLFVAFILATAVIGYFIRTSKSDTVAGSLVANVSRILRNLELDILLLAAFVSGFMCGVQESFLFWFLVNSLDGPHALIGIDVVIQCFAETVMLVLSGRIIKKFGTNWCLCAAFAAHGLRFVLYSFLVNPWCVLSIEPLQGICFGLFYPAMTNRASELTPSGMHATVQGLFGTLYVSIGRAVGAAVAGVLYDNVGPRNMFRISSGVSFSFIIVLIITGLRRNRSTSGAAGGQAMTITVSLQATIPPTPTAINGHQKERADADKELSSSEMHMPI